VLADFRFGAHFGLKPDIAPGPKSATADSCTAANRIFGADEQAVGTSKPRAMVAVRSIISSNLGGCSTGMVLRGFPFFRLRSAELAYFVA